ncbi:LysM peptidoglycan-binding domain-containing protein [Anaerotignum sp.]|nr:LysM peptidoglycan-binding domain-containing protein [Anaerotignum sp.]MBQ7758451.1 LysM peptidoglycan-binding domain-containing protein [Anaerotignum sp.]
MYRLYLKQDGKQILLPVTPAEIQTKTGNRNKAVYILNFGEMNLAKKPGLQEIRFTALLPGRQYSFVQTEDGFHEPEYFLNYFKEYKAAAKPVQLILFRRLADGTQLFCGNMEVLLEDYTVTEKGGEQGDFWVEMHWKEWKTAKSIRYSVKGNTMVEQGQERAAKTAAATYTVQKGDCLWNIAKKQLGDGTKYKEIAQKNGISNPNLIYPGQVLKL